MRPVAGSVTFEHEVDDAVWASVADARTLLTYERDRPLLDEL